MTQVSTHGARERHPLRVATAALLASAIEWYDFLIYGTAAALIFGTVFFPTASPVAGVLASFGTFAVGFVARPFGGAIFGHFGDRIGRKRALVVAVLMMAVATVAIGLLPTYHAIGIWAPIALLVLRVIQGIAVGGQWGGAMLLATESAPPGRRGLYGSFPQLGVPAGLVAGTVIYLLLTRELSADAFSSWGWRIPFLLSVLTLPIALYIHRNVEDSAEFRAAETEERSGDRDPAKPSGLQVIRRQPGTVLLAGLTCLAGQAAFYIAVTGMIDYGTRELGIARTTLLNSLLVSMAGFAIAMVLSAWLSDHVGRKPIYVLGSVALGGWGFAFFPLLATKHTWAIMVALLVLLASIGMTLGPLPALFSEMFPPAVRYTGASLGYQLGAILGGGLAPFIMVAILNSTHNAVWVSVYLAVAALVAVGAVLSIRLRPDGEHGAGLDHDSTPTTQAVSTLPQHSGLR
ncbi:MFS transporter [Rhodococcus sp. NPDC059234]|uniref:MFS transporter n=1 Tax=Rhodococcus sp. NPDC059234 TaxID=3346781 RepID=UPI003672E967